MSNDQPMIPGRRILTADDLFDMKWAKPHFEFAREIGTPGGEFGDITRCWAFSIDGRLRGQRVDGALFAGECIVVQAHEQHQAEVLAKDGLDETIRLLREEYDARAKIDLNAGVMTEVAGRKGVGADGTLRTDPKLKRMLGHLIGGEKWKH